jgi:hypothetical protein
VSFLVGAGFIGVRLGPGAEAPRKSREDLIAALKRCATQKLSPKAAAHPKAPSQSAAQERQPKAPSPQDIQLKGQPKDSAQGCCPKRVAWPEDPLHSTRSAVPTMVRSKQAVCSSEPSPGRAQDVVLNCTVAGAAAGVVSAISTRKCAPVEKGKKKVSEAMAKEPEG